MHVRDIEWIRHQCGFQGRRASKLGVGTGHMKCKDFWQYLGSSGVSQLSLCLVCLVWNDANKIPRSIWVSITLSLECRPQLCWSRQIPAQNNVSTNGWRRVSKEAWKALSRTLVCCAGHVYSGTPEPAVSLKRTSRKQVVIFLLHRMGRSPPPG